ncbi:protein kinase domain-containing protein [Nocardia niigatensis]|uniref:protein kinase domain-containing protein n=1 Tax=Nocardia niigatensis TaxID=209249 RepID=UPI000686BF91|nr:protein kinase [Nocardia niigatensis]
MGDLLQRGDVFAGYTIERLLGRGGMGAVYLARHPRLPRWTALKLLSPELFADTEIRGRFEREAEAVTRLEHPNIVAVHDRGLELGGPWIAMQYIDGTDAESVRVPPAGAIRIVTQVAAALDHAHTRGVLHRDVKPANILLEHGHSERALLTDFGIAQLHDAATRLTRTGTFTATLAYAAPEQLVGHPLDHRTDQYSLACTLFHLLTGTPPYPADNPAAIIQAHLRAGAPSVRRHRPDLPPALDAVLATALAKKPSQRYPSCTAFAHAAQQALTATARVAPASPAAPAPARSGPGASPWPAGGMPSAPERPPVDAVPPGNPAMNQGVYGGGPVPTTPWTGLAGNVPPNAGRGPVAGFAPPPVQRQLHLSTAASLLLSVPAALTSLLIVLTLGATLGGVWALLITLAWLASGGLVFVPAVENTLARWYYRVRRPLPEEAALLGTAWNRVTARAGINGAEYSLWVEDSRQINAFAAAGHLVSVTRWSLTSLLPQQLEAVLAHELGHHLGGHAAARLLAHWYCTPARVAWRWGLFAVTGISAVLSRLAPLLWLVFACCGLGIVGGVFRAGERAVGPVGATALVLLLLALPFLQAALSRNEELRADRTAVDLGYGPALYSVLESWAHREMAAGPQPLRAGLLSSHPASVDRMRAVHARIQTLTPPLS